MASPNIAEIQIIIFAGKLTQRIHQVIVLMDIIVESHNPALIV